MPGEDACVHTQSLLTICYPMDCSPLGSSVHGIFFRQEYWNGLSFPTPVDWNGLSFPTPGVLHNPGSELESPASPALAGGFLLLSHLGSPPSEDGCDLLHWWGCDWVTCITNSLKTLLAFDLVNLLLDSDKYLYRRVFITVLLIIIKTGNYLNV